MHGRRTAGSILPPPGSSGVAGRVSSRSVDADDAVLARVRALLAQAESTTYGAEAAAFTAKAQELMARHAIDHALVWERAGRDESPVTVRLPVDDPYADAKSLLLQIVATHSRCRAVFHERYTLSTIVGFASDVELVSSTVRGGADAFGRARGRMAADQAQLRFGDLDGSAADHDEFATASV